MQVDELDHQIIASLSENARRSFHEVGTQVGLSAPAVKRRVDRLRHTGVILGFTTRVDPARVGWSIEAFVEVFCEGNVHPAKIRAIVADIPEVLHAYTVTGAADAMLQVQAVDMRDLEDVIQQVRDHPGISQTRSTIVLSRL